MTNIMIEFSPLLPMPYIWMAGALALILATFVLWRGGKGALLRVLALACLLLALTDPQLRSEERKSLSNIAIVMVDETISQSIAKRTDRTEQLRAELEQKLKNVPNLEIRWISASNKSDDGKEGTTLFADLNRGLAGVPPDRLAGVIMITDGVIHDVPVSAKDLTTGSPIHALITGDKNEFDRRIEIVKAPRFGLVDSEDTVKFRIVEQGESRNKGAPAKVTIIRKGLPDEERIIPIGKTAEFELSFPHAGENIAEIALAPVKGELTTANNRTLISAEGVRENLRVLLVSGEPHAGERTWRNLLKSDAAVDLVHFTILRPPEKQDGTPINQLSLIAFPTRELFAEKLDGFDLIIFDRYQRRNVLPILYLDNIARFVEQGGAVLVAAGTSYSSGASLYRTPLSQVLPAAPTGRIIEKPFRATMTEDGIKHPVTTGLPGGDIKTPSWGRWFRLVEATPSNGQILMNGAEDKPLLLLDRLGEGRVALLLSDHAWLWARGYDGGGPYADLLRRTAHWLMKEPDLEEEFLKAKGRGKNLFIERRSMSETVAPVKVTGPDSKPIDVELDNVSPGVWRKSLADVVPGLYRVRSGELDAIANVGPMNSREVAKVAATGESLSEIQKEIGGGVFWMGSEASQNAKAAPRISMLQTAKTMHGTNWLALRDRQAHLVEGVKMIPLFTGLVALAALLGLISIAWYREGR